MIGKLLGIKWNDNPHQIALNRRLASWLPHPLQGARDPGITLNAGVRRCNTRCDQEAGPRTFESPHVLIFRDGKLPPSVSFWTPPAKPTERLGQR
jgi:hypothetical protein